MCFFWGLELLKKKIQSEIKSLKAFGNRVRDLRLKSGQTVYDLTGEDMPIKSRQHWQAIENGRKNINLTTILKIARTLGVDTKALF